MDWKKILAYATGIFIGLAVGTLPQTAFAQTPTPTPTSTPTPTPTSTPTPTPFPTATPVYYDDARSRFDPVPTAMPQIPNYGIWQNSPEVATIELGSALINQPRAAAAAFAFPVIDLPELVLPDIQPSVEWPSLTAGRNGALAYVHAELQSVRSTLNGQYSLAREELSAFKQTTAGLREFIGSPDSVVARAGGRTVTVTGMAQEMANSVSFALGYLRAVSALGPMGFDLVFLFIGLAWLLFVNLLEWLIQIISAGIKFVLNILNFIWHLFMALLELIQMLRSLVPFL